MAQSEAALRRELEDKGLHVLSLKPRLGIGGFSFGGESRKITRHEFLVFNQELATLLKAGMPLVQSLDILRARLSNPGLQVGARRRHEKVRGGTALSDAFAAHGDLFPVRLHRVADGRRALGQSRRGAAPLRRVLEDDRHGSLEDHLGDDLSGHPGRCWRSCWSASSWSRWCRRSRSSTAASTPSCRCRRASSSRSRTSSARSCWLILIAIGRRRARGS